jgi:hypothetical protein
VKDHVPLYASAYAGFGAGERSRRETYGDDLGQSSRRLTAEVLKLFAAWLEVGEGLAHGLESPAGAATRARVIVLH